MNKKGWREKQREKGYRDKLLWLSTKTLEILEKRKEEGESDSDVVNRLIQETEGISNSEVYSDSNSDIRLIVEDLRERIEVLEGQTKTSNCEGYSESNITNTSDTDNYINKLKE